MPNVTIYHNPRCSKSRQTLKLLREHDVEPHIVEYLVDPPDAATLRKLVRMLSIKPIELVRRTEPQFTDLGLVDKQDDDEAIITAMASHPILIERPIVVSGGQARLGRPPEQVLEIL